MVNIVGKGIKDLKNIITKCKESDGTIFIRTGIAGKKFNDRIILSCIDSKNGSIGGMITGIDESIINEINKIKIESKKGYKEILDNYEDKEIIKEKLKERKELTFKKMLRITENYNSNGD